MKKINKRFIYFPIYLIVLALSVYWLYGTLTEPRLIEEVKPMVVISQSSVDPAFLNCYEENRKSMQGMLYLMPPSKLETTFLELEGICFDKMCSDFQEISKGEKQFESVQRRTGHLSHCYNPIFDAALIYHNEVLSETPVVGLFYDEGAFQLSQKQREKLRNILSVYRVNANEYKLLVIGRASVKGNQSQNEVLSQKRAEGITDYVSHILDGEMESDYVYFGSQPPQLDLDLSYRYHIQKEDYENVKTSSPDKDYKIRLNQSVLIVIYPISDDPFEISAD